MSKDGIRKPFTRAARNSARPGDRNNELLRDKDNAGKEHTPRFAQYPAPNLAPHGMKGIQRQQFALAKGSELNIQLMKDDYTNAYHGQGRITSMEGYAFSIIVENQPSRFGMEGGRISKLEITKDNNQVLAYDGRWLLLPETPDAYVAMEKITSQIAPPDLSIDPDRFQPGELTDGYVPERENVTFHAKVEPENHREGFKGGPVTFLDLRENGLTVARYDHGWVMEPQTQKDRDSVQKISDTLEGFNREFKPLVPPDHDKDKGPDIDR